jgi:hypothetical protein
MKFENTSVFNFDGAMRGMRNPKNSWDKGDSGYGCYDGAIKGLCRDCDGNPKAYCALREYVIGQNDLALAQSLIKAGSEHRKFMRQIFVSVDITAPLYWWKEFDTYKVGTVANSTSTMHKLASTPIDFNCFEFDDTTKNELGYIADGKYTVSDFWISVIKGCESLRQKYNETKDIRYWKELIRLLPESWLQKRTVTMDYENLLAICSKGQRRFHKLTEWSKAFINWARTLPYAQELIFLDEKEEK